MADREVRLPFVLVLTAFRSLGNPGAVAPFLTVGALLIRSNTKKSRDGLGESNRDEQRPDREGGGHYTSLHKFVRNAG
jgi:hypothetical protein